MLPRKFTLLNMVVVTTMLLSGGLGPWPAQAQAPQVATNSQPGRPEFAPGVVLVGLKPGVTLEAPASGSLQAAEAEPYITNSAALAKSFKALAVSTEAHVFPPAPASALGVQSAETPVYTHTKVKLINREAFGYRNFENFRLHLLMAFGQ